MRMLRGWPRWVTVLVVTVLTLAVLFLALRFARGEFFCGVRGGMWVEEESEIQGVESATEYCVES